MQYRAIFWMKFTAQMLILKKSTISDLSAYPKKLERAKETQIKWKESNKNRINDKRNEKGDKSITDCLKK